MLYRNQIKRINRLLFLVLTALFVLTRLLRLDGAPFTAEGMHFDEMSAAYDAWCIQGWGVDRHLIRFPVYFMNTGPGQNALYIYLAAIMFKIAGFSLFKFRLIAVFCAFAAYICLYHLSKLMIKNERYVLIPVVLMTIMPVFLMSEHWGLESYLLLSFSIISFYFLARAVDRSYGYLIAGVLWGVSLYSYGISYIIEPVFLLLALVYLLYLRKVNIRNILAVAVPMVMLGLPLAVEQMVTAGMIEPFSLKYMDFFPIEKYRAGEIAIRNIPYNLLHSTYTLMVKDVTLYNGCPYFGVIYYISVPFMISGLILCVIKAIRSVKSREYDPYVLVLLFYVVSRGVSLVELDTNINRANAVYFPYLVFTALGIEYLFNKTKNNIWVIVGVSIAYFATFILFAKWAYSGGEFSWNYETRPRTKEYIIEDIHTGLAIQEAREAAKGRPLQMIINDVHGRYLQICLFAGTSPYDYNEEGYTENGYNIGVPEDLDLSGDTVYLIEDKLHHITDYMVSEGFTNQLATHGQFSVVYK